MFVSGDTVAVVMVVVVTVFVLVLLLLLLLLLLIIIIIVITSPAHISKQFTISWKKQNKQETSLTP